MKRYELKYVLNREQHNSFINALKDHMQIDPYGKTVVHSLYYDTDNFHLLRTSISNPSFKEKMRVRLYGENENKGPLFLEIKRKFNGVVYKRRAQIKYEQIKQFFDFEIDLIENNQIAREINYFRDYYHNLKPVVMIVSERTAYVKENSDIRITVDENLSYDFNHLDFRQIHRGKSIIDQDHVVLEIKVQGAMPLWLVNILSKSKIYGRSFSKVGEAYKKHLSQMELEKGNN